MLESIANGPKAAEFTTAEVEAAWAAAIHDARTNGSFGATVWDVVYRLGVKAYERGEVAVNVMPQVHEVLSSLETQMIGLVPDNGNPVMYKWADESLYN